MGDNAYGYAYDPIGSRIVTTENTETTEYLANELNPYTNILCVPASLRLNHDADGNLLTNGVWSFTWDAEIKRAQSPRHGRRATAILRPGRRDGARSGIPRRSGNRYRLILASNATTLVRNTYDPRSRRIRKEVSAWDEQVADYVFTICNIYSFLFQRRNSTGK